LNKNQITHNWVWIWISNHFQIFSVFSLFKYISNVSENFEGSYSFSLLNKFLEDLKFENSNNFKWKVGFRKLQRDYQFDSFKLPTLFLNLKKSFYLLSRKSLSCIKFLNLKYFQWNSNLFKNPFHLFNGRNHTIFTLGFCVWIWIHGDQNARWKFWESPFIPSHSTFKKFQILLNFTQSIT
jgi:hypothetical protein